MFVFTKTLKTMLEPWESFYVIVGSSAGALIGLQFVVITLMGERPVPRGEEAGAAFMTPSVVHFSMVLSMAALLSAPWHGMVAVAWIWGIMGFVGLAYSAIVGRRLRAQSVYKPVLEDWLFHLLLPLVAYVVVASSACMAISHPRPALFAVGASTLLLLLVGIHNAWDAVTYQVFVRRADEADRSPKDPPSEA